MKKIGIIAGKFRVLHNGHKEYFYKASLEDLEILYIFVNSDQSLVRTIPLMETIQAIGKCMQVLDINYKIVPYSVKDEDFEQYLIDLLGPNNLIGFNLSEKYSLTKIKEKRLDIVLSNSLTTQEIMQDLYNPIHFNNIAVEFRTYLNKKVVISGTESCGKTQMSIKLAGILQTEYSSEYGRYHATKFMGGEDSTYLPNQFVQIGMQQNIQDKIKNEQANRCLIVDTDPIVTLRFLNSYMERLDAQSPLSKTLLKEWQDATNFLESMCKTYKSDLTILLAPSVRYVKDDIRWEQDQKIREKNHQDLKNLYDKFKIRYIEINEDTYAKRFNKVVAIINQQLFNKKGEI